MSQEDKMFNLQLIIQKLEEELSLYRNGTTATELLELISEKDVEIETWRAKCEERDEKLRRLAKTSGDVLLKYERLQEELQKNHNHINESEYIIKDYSEQIMECENKIRQLEVIATEKHAEVRQKDDIIGSLRLELWDLKQSQDSKIKDELITMEMVKKDLERMVSQKDDELNQKDEDIYQLKKEMESIQSDLSKYKHISQDQEASIEKLQKRCASLIAEKSDKLKQLDAERQEMIQHIQQFRESMNQNLAQRDEALRRKDDKIRDLQFQISLLQQQLKAKLQRPVGTTSNNHSTAAVGGIGMDAINFQIMAEEVPESTTAQQATSSKSSQRFPLGEKTNAMGIAATTASVTNDVKKVSIHHTTTTIPPVAAHTTTISK